MKKLLILAALLFASPSFAQEKQVYRPFRYETPCGLQKETYLYEDTCVVVETREPNGALRTRNIFSNRLGLTIKGRFDKEKGYIQWDSYNKFEYPWSYKISGTDWTEVMPNVIVQNISWD